MFPKEILEDGAEVFEEKNEDYGDAWRVAAELLWEMNEGDEIVLSSEKEAVSLGLYLLRLIKIARSVNGEFNVEELNNEEIGESDRDEMVYAAIHAAFHEQ